MEVRELQDRIVATRSARGFVTDPVKLCVLMAEEVGELASEIKKTWSLNYTGTTKDKLAEECADVYVVLAAIAHAFDIDIEYAVAGKFFTRDANRPWATQSRPGQSQERSP